MASVLAAMIGSLRPSVRILVTRVTTVAERSLLSRPFRTPLARLYKSQLRDSCGSSVSFFQHYPTAHVSAAVDSLHCNLNSPYSSCNHECQSLCWVSVYDPLTRSELRGRAALCLLTDCVPLHVM